MKRVCVCGGRDFSDRANLFAALDVLLKKMKYEFVLIHGGARGADSLAGEWAKERGIRTEVFLADWNKFKRSAGHIRNKEMLDSGIDLLIAFPGGKGTENMKSICKAAGVSVLTSDRFYDSVEKLETAGMV